MTTLSKRLQVIESALMPKPENNLIIHLFRAGRETETPIGYRNHLTGEIYEGVENPQIDNLKGYNVLMAIYPDSN